MRPWMALLVLLMTSCSPSLRSSLPLSAGAPPRPDTVLAWVGTGEGWRMVDGEWVRAEEQDYVFHVIQRRFSDRWASTKVVHRYRTSYDGAAGDRDALWHFALEYAEAARDRLDVRVVSSIGEGSGWADPTFEHATLTLTADVSPMAPFDHYRITQHYDYAAGRLEETVLLYDAGPSGEEPWFKSEERATLMAPQQFDAPPTTWSADDR